MLDAPQLQDDFDLNLVDWSSQNVLAVGLGTCVYLYSACTSKVRGPAGRCRALFILKAPVPQARLALCQRFAMQLNTCACSGSVPHQVPMPMLPVCMRR